MRVETEEGSYGYQLADEIDVRPEDWQIGKRRYSTLIPGSTDPDLVDQLRQHGIDTLIITGTLTNVCCESTARDATMLNFNTILVADANATRSDAEHNATLTSAIQVFADVRFTKDVVKLLE